MTDRELLELAAKAAGIALEVNDLDPGYWAEWRGLPQWVNWDPLADDGDALRMVISLGMCVDVGRRPVGFSEASVIIDDERVSAEEYHDADPCAATRRAIVRAAAEIGKGVE